MGSKYTKRYTEFKRDAIALVDSSGKTVTAVARGEDAPGELTSTERDELRRLHKENREQQQTIEIPKKSDLGLNQSPQHQLPGGIVGELPRVS
ncbi:hypothetical protein OG728_37095 [Streptomyces microflavus]|uniref:hypothetical protein n=1 Tax=Streptomyces TaxID=1883 RepID=UPI000B91A383|nr:MULTISPECIES: hypothetical protein [Streptomyces]OXY84705.1 hypothetical protein BEH93_23470 [Streptomyces sp. 2R]WSR95694.1 hypothetical protein OG728_37095 [Streptomyces microflavus]